MGSCDFTARFRVTTETVVLHNLPESRSPSSLSGSIMIEPMIKRFGQHPQASCFVLRNLPRVGLRRGQDSRGVPRRGLVTDLRIGSPRLEGEGSVWRFCGTNGAPAFHAGDTPAAASTYGCVVGRVDQRGRKYCVKNLLQNEIWYLQKVALFSRRACSAVMVA